MTFILPTKSIMVWTRDSVVLSPTEHNRSTLSVPNDRMKNSDRMIDASLREYFIADKRTWSVSWDELPAPTSETVDGKAGGYEIEKFYKETKKAFNMKIQHKDSGLDEDVMVVFSDFDKSHIYRGAYDMWELSLSLEEC